jgi:pantoate--beta-alanine ligase
LAFTPSVEEVYSPSHATTVEVGPVALPLEGEHRPSHFRGVATVVLKLFHFAPADVAYFGRKDYQQTLVVKQMVADLNVPIEIRVLPTIREADGLAMSSRNANLGADERSRALALHQSLQLAQQLVDQGERRVATIRNKMEMHIARVGDVNVHYIAFVADGTVTPVQSIRGPTVVAVAAKVGATRLIDNVLLEFGP